MDIEDIVGEVVRGALGVRRGRRRGFWGHVAPRHALLNGTTLLGALGVAWGLYETMTEGGSPQVPAPRSGASGPTASSGAPPPVPSDPAASLPAEVPTSDASALPVAAPGEGAPAADGSGVVGNALSVAPEVARVIRLTVSATRADGTLTPAEEEAILAHARTVGAEPIVSDELKQPTPLSQLVANVPDAARSDLYTLAYAIVHADDAVSGAERIFLAQLAHGLGLDKARAAALEDQAARRLTAAVQDGPNQSTV